MSPDLDLDPHIILAQPRYTDTSPEGLVIRHPFPEIARHGFERFVVDWHMIRVDPVYLPGELDTTDCTLTRPFRPGGRR